ncbi:uncharacterized protein DUF397 [Halopolyspora algeriensis]|uniref:Uncharacterized protein DUF397 n=1 Tax=Halopolyspora algeriensis TaxID=1500506 RepID=A0A368V8N8_9ACTN|nr:DUF397 domain-containing protein [Halopolyspora algeriensis]RCW37478.1 uncharacterized protein DUF397 [Halopolyspora algeriensis]TQM42574.1 uncharacterized protein DUF397 [Halopolyspora algeriensis]
MITWQKSSYSGPSGNCVEVGFTIEAIGVRDTKARQGGQLTLAPARWHSFLTALKHGTYDRRRDRSPAW